MARIKQRTSIPSLSIPDRRLTPVDHLVLAVLCSHEDHQTHIATAKRNDIANILGVTEATVSVATKRLQDFGWIIKSGAGRGIQYHINWSNEPFAQPNSSVTTNGSPNLTVDPVGENQGTTISSNINNYNNKHISDQIIRSEDQTVNFITAVHILQQHGCPYSINEKSNDLNASIVWQWVQAGHTVGLVKHAAKMAEDSPTRTAAVGPKYVNGCIETITRQNNAPQRLAIPRDNEDMAKFALREFNMRPGVGESWETFRRKVQNAVEKRTRRAA